MYIEIEEDIIKDAISKSNNVVNTSLDLLYLFALSAYKGRHYITVPCLVNNKDLCSKLQQIMSKRILNMLRSAEREYVQWKTIRENVIVHAVVTYKKLNPQNDIIIVDPHDESNFEPYTKCRVLTEHINDSAFFEYLVRFYKNTHNLSKCKTCFDPLMGGGFTTADILMHEVCNREHFCLVISDSDKKWPNGKNGETAIKIENVMNSLKPFNCYFYVMKDVMEIENLIPKKVFDVIACERFGYKKIFEKESSYFDMKKGLCISDLYNDRICKYWKELLKDEPINFSERDTAKKNSKNKEAYLKEIKDKHYANQLCAGFGTDLLEMCVLKDKNVAHPEVVDILNNIKREDLTDAQLKEWMNIGQIMFSWTCCSRVHQ